jgi:acyl-CoA synthetase (AMP-forming)/AMP-acid ligase II
MSTALGLTEQQIHAVGSADVVIRSLLERNAREAPDEVFVTFEGGTSWTRGEGLEVAGAAARALRAAGLGHGDRVAVFLPNCPDFLAAWWGAALLGAVTFPMNTALRGTALQRALDTGDPSAVVAAPDLAPRLDELLDLNVTRLSPTSCGIRKSCGVPTSYAATPGVCQSRIGRSGCGTTSCCL